MQLSQLAGMPFSAGASKPYAELGLKLWFYPEEIMYFGKPAYFMNPPILDVPAPFQFIGPPLDSSVEPVTPMAFLRIQLNGATYEPMPLTAPGSWIKLDKDKPEYLDFEKEVNSSCAMFIHYYTAFQMTSSENCISGWTGNFWNGSVL